MTASIQGNAVSFWAVEQTNPASGVPANPTWFNLRRNSGDIDIQKSFTQSDETDISRQPSYNILTSSSVSGSISRELSVADPAVETLVKGALQSNLVGNIAATGSTVFNTAGKSVELTGAFTNAVVGQFFVAYGTVSNNRVFKITSKVSNNKVEVSPAPVTETIAATLSGKAYRNSNKAKAFAVQKRVPTDAGVLFNTFEGCQIGSMSLGITAESIVTLDFDMMGLGQLPAFTQVAGSTDVALNGSRVLGSVSGVTEYWIDGIPTSAQDVCYTDISFSIDNAGQGNPAIGKEGYCNISFNKATITGSLVSYVDGTNPTTARSELVKRNNETLFGLGFTMRDADGNYMIVEFPAAQYTEVTQDETANGDVLRNNGSFGAVGVKDGYAVEITFATAP
jgi:hypothetical protein